MRPLFCPQTGHYNLETCLSVLLLALAMVMAGSGNLKVLQLCRFMHKKTGGEMNYGFHLAHHMALGLLFLGGGRSLVTSKDVFCFFFHLSCKSWSSVQFT